MKKNRVYKSRDTVPLMFVGPAPWLAQPHCCLNFPFIFTHTQASFVQLFGDHPMVPSLCLYVVWTSVGGNRMPTHSEMHFSHV